MKNWLDGELFSLKCVRPCIQNVNRSENKLKRVQYLEAIFQARASGRTLIWVDETNYNLYCRRKQGRSKIGSLSSALLPSSKGANLHCIGAMTDSRMVLFTTRRGAFKAADFNSWVENLIDAPTLIDNAPAHARMEEIIAEHLNVQRICLAPYSYLLNAIELVWSSFKSHIKRGLREGMTELVEVQFAGGTYSN